MAFRLYLVPMVDVVRADGKTSTRAKYLASEEGFLTPGYRYHLARYGSQPWALAGADLSGANDTLLAAQTDVTALPVNLDATLTGPQVTATQTKLEAANIPAGWVNTGLTWRQVVRTVLGMCALLQRFRGLNGPTRLFGGAITMNSTIGDIPVTPRGNLTDAATSLGFSTAGITLATTIRSALKTLADQASAMAFDFNGVTV